jgi:Ni/Co efflux regulator RcnB
VIVAARTIDEEFMNMGGTMMKRLLMTVIATTFAAAAFAQVEPAVKETGKAVAESAKQGGDNVKAAVSTEPNKSVNKAKAKVHKAKARVHRHKAKKAADAAMH